MMAQVRTLLRVKELKLREAERTMRAKRQQLNEARTARMGAQAEVEDSARTYADRENAIYADILGQVIDLDGVDKTQGRVVQLQRHHTRLRDELDRAGHVEARIEDEMEAALAHYSAAMRSRDKFTTITDDMEAAEQAVAETREESEIEELTIQSKRGVP